MVQKSRRIEKHRPINYYSQLLYNTKTVYKTMKCEKCKHEMNDHKYMYRVCMCIINDTEFPYCDCCLGPE